ncbi:MAG: hypothetical protein [Olavius algarvensis Delta 4 endosymbiont]|nr:MAG: hypothetical protein [Olavius algarvensis Delta 4 endosymbiont]
MRNSTVYAYTPGVNRIKRPFVNGIAACDLCPASVPCPEHILGPEEG